MVGKDTSFSAPVSRRNVSSAAAASISVSWPLAASASNQARKRDSAAPSRICAARVPASSTAFLTAFISAIGSALTIALPPAASSAWISRAGAVAASKTIRAPAAPRAATKANERVRRRDLGEAAEPRADRLRELPRVDEQGRPAVARRISESERQRRMGDVAAADVEQPGDGMGVADQQAVGAFQRLADALQLGRRALAGEPLGMGADRRQRRARTVGPDRVDRVRLDRDQFAAGGAAGLLQPFDRFRRVQPGVVTERRARRRGSLRSRPTAAHGRRA